MLSQLSAGKIYNWDELKQYSNSLGRDVQRLLDNGSLEKVGPGLYYVPKKSRYGYVPPKDKQLIQSFLKSNDFLLFSPNQYNELGLGLTQLKNEVVVYNNKRHGPVELSNRTYQFRRPNNGFPTRLTREFLLVDLLNNIKTVGESPNVLHKKIAMLIEENHFDNKLLLKLSELYGKINTKKLLNQFDPENHSNKRVA